MPALEIKIIPDPILRMPTEEVGTFDSRLHKFLDDMYDTMLSAHGLGLAAPQVGDTRRIAIIDLTVDGMDAPEITPAPGVRAEDHIFKGRLEIINPKIREGGKKVVSDEGCLSIPDYRDSVQRHNRIVVSATDRAGRQFTVAGTDLLSFALQHEIDHLDGILFTDHLSRLKKTLFQRWYQKNLSPDGTPMDTRNPTSI